MLFTTYFPFCFVLGAFGHNKNKIATETVTVKYDVVVLFMRLNL